MKRFFTVFIFMLTASVAVNSRGNRYEIYDRLHEIHDKTEINTHDVNELTAGNKPATTETRVYSAAQYEKIKADLQNAITENRQLKQEITTEKRRAEQQRRLLESADIETQRMKANISLHENEKAIHRIFNEQQIMKLEADKNRTRTKVLLSGVAMMI